LPSSLFAGKPGPETSSPETAPATMLLPPLSIGMPPASSHLQGTLTEPEKVMAYIDGFVIAVPTAHRETYKKVAETAAAVFKEHGALKVVECWGDDVPEGKVTSFPMAVKRKDDETVVFSWVVWPSRQMRDAGNKKVMEDERMKPGKEPMPFDGQRMIFGGFEVLLER
jgi:uncharacterized protein YbaA (DUF1428 family)